MAPDTPTNVTAAQKAMGPVIGWDPITGPIAFWAAVTFVGVSGAILLLVALGRGAIRLLSKSGIQNYYKLTFALALVTVSFVPLPFIGLSWQGFYDRYVIAFLPWLMFAAVAAICIPNAIRSDG